MRTTLITGGNRGIGRAVVDLLTRSNHNVINISRTSNNCLASTRVENHIGDISNIEKTHELVSTIVAKNRIDNVILNAGITNDKFFHKMSLDAWRDVLDTNLSSAYGVLHPVVNQMRNNGGGNVILMASVNAHSGALGQTNYSASKSGLLALSRSLALENANKNIFCNVISPGYTRTDMVKDINPEVSESIRSTIPMKRFASPEEIAQIVLFLTKNSYIQGSNIDVNGGLIMR